MSDFDVYPSPGVGRFVTKQDAVGQGSLNGTTAAVASTSSANATYGAWVQVVASTSVAYYLTGIVALAQATNTSVLGPLFVDVGIGGSGAETRIATGIIIGAEWQGTTSVYHGGRDVLDPPLRVAVGDRVAVRVALANSNGAARSYGVFLSAAPFLNVDGN